MPNYDPLFYWIEKREDLRISGKTDDSILKEFRFCNVRREDDRVTIWINENIRKPYTDHPYLWLMLCISRQLNWPATLNELINSDAWPIDETFNPKLMTIKLNERKAKGEKVYTGAYMISAPHTKGADKQAYIAEEVIGKLWEYRKEFKEYSTSLEKLHGWLMCFNGWGPFMAYQAIVDMRFTNILCNAPDIYNWAAAGPGTLRGLNRIYLRDKNQSLSQQQALKEIKETYNILIQKNICKLDFSDVPNVYCETDKYMRTWYKEGTPRAKYIKGRGF